MFAYISGKLKSKLKEYVVIDAGGIGYKVYMSEKSIETIGEIEENIKVYTYYYVREDNISIYGFKTDDELKMFELLLSVSGIGAKSAIIMLSNITPSNFILAIISNDISKLTKIPGIGTKSAQRIVLELKDKLKKQEVIPKNTEEIHIETNKSENIDEAISALQVLGYNKKEIEKAIEKFEFNTMTIEEIIKKALANLGK